MSEPKVKSSKPPARPSGTMHAVRIARAKMDSIDENTLPLIDEATDALDRVLATIPPTPEQIAEAAEAQAEPEKPDDEQ